MIKSIKKNVKVVWLVFKDVFCCSPLATLFVVFNNFFACMFPAITVAINTRLFDGVERYIKTSNGFNLIIKWSITIVILYAVQKMLEIASNAIENVAVFEKYISKSRINIASKMSSLDLIDYEKIDIREKQERANYCVEYEKISQLFLTLLSIVTNTIGVISVMIVLAQYSIFFLFISILSVVPFFVVKKKRGNEFYYMKYMQASKSRKLNYLWSLFGDKQVAKETRIMFFGNYLIEKWIECRDDINNEIWKLRVKDAISLLICENIETIGYVLGLVCTMMLVWKGYITIGVFCACTYAFLEVQNQTKNFLIQLGFVPEMINYIYDYFSFIEKKEIKEDYGYSNIKKMDITLKNVDFKYPDGEEKALDNINLVIKENDFIVIVGENGSGKTTLGKLLMGLYQPSTGTITFDDTDISNINSKYLYDNFSVVAQKFVKYMLSLRENIIISNVHCEPDDDKVLSLLRSIELNELTEIGLDQAMGTEFGGIDLSGGQWQKLAIARAMYCNSKLLFFDEPTSAIDPVTEQMIFNNVISFAEGKTAVVVSHRVSLCNHATKVIVMKKGKVEAVGTHDELMNTSGYYRELYLKQSSWYK